MPQKFITSADLKFVQHVLKFVKNYDPLMLKCGVFFSRIRGVYVDVDVVSLFRYLCHMHGSFIFSIIYVLSSLCFSRSPE